MLHLHFQNGHITSNISYITKVQFNRDLKIMESTFKFILKGMNLHTYLHLVIILESMCVLLYLFLHCTYTLHDVCRRLGNHTAVVILSLLFFPIAL